MLDNRKQLGLNVVSSKILCRRPCTGDEDYKILYAKSVCTWVGTGEFREIVRTGVL
jgi:hypothetical protein